MNNHQHDFPPRFYARDKQNPIISPVKVDKLFSHVPGDELQVQKARFYHIGTPTILLALLVGIYFMF